MAGKPKGTGKQVNTSKRWKCAECGRCFDDYHELVKHGEEHNR